MRVFADEFARFLEEWGVDPEDEEAVAALFADWLAQRTGQAIIGGPLGDAPAVVALPDE